EAHTRFLREAETAMRLRHPAIVQVSAAGEADGVGYLVMELLRGHDLTRYTTLDSLLRVERVLHVGEQIALALDYAHREGVVHRALKPANVMFDPSSGRVAVTDFGIARLVDAARTRSGVLLGTPAFLAPELLMGREATARSDLYALGVTLF